MGEGRDEGDNVAIKQLVVSGLKMQTFNQSILKSLYKAPPSSHKGQNGKLLIIGGSHLFHSASLWALKVASRIVDMVFYSSVPENNEIVKSAKEEFRDGIVVPRGRVEEYIQEADSILIGPGLPRPEGKEIGDDDTKELTERLLNAYPHKQWVIDGGSLQVIDPSIVPKNAILTPHRKEFEKLFGIPVTSNTQQELSNEDVIGHVSRVAQEFGCVVLLKGQEDVVCSPAHCVLIHGGNPGMTKGGTGDALAGLVAALACKNDPFLAAQVGSYVNKKAGDALYERVGPYFNTSDLVDEIPKVLGAI